MILGHYFQITLPFKFYNYGFIPSRTADLSSKLKLGFKIDVDCCVIVIAFVCIVVVLHKTGFVPYILVVIIEVVIDGNGQ